MEVVEGSDLTATCDCGTPWIFHSAFFVACGSYGPNIPCSNVMSSENISKYTEHKKEKKCNAIYTSNSRRASAI